MLRKNRAAMVIYFKLIRKKTEIRNNNLKLENLTQSFYSTLWQDAFSLQVEV
jgi:hypothetical protein